MCELGAAALDAGALDRVRRLDAASVGFGAVCGVYRPAIFQGTAATRRLSAVLAAVAPADSGTTARIRHLEAPLGLTGRGFLFLMDRWRR